MNYYYPFLFLVVFFSWSGLRSQNSAATSFDQLLEELQQLEAPDREYRIETFISRQRTLPLVENDQVIFLAKGSPFSNPQLLADFNGFMHPRYVPDSTLSVMIPVDGTHWYYRKVKLLPDAVVDYQYFLDGKEICDPLNPRVRLTFGSLVSFLTMPEYSEDKDVIPDFAGIGGTLIRDSIYSQSQSHWRNIHIYLPPGYNQTKDRLPVVFFHDGSMYVSEAMAPSILDKLISRRLIEPVIAVFDDPVVRGREYRGDNNYRRYIENELIPYIRNQYHTLEGKSNYAVIGGSRGGQSALYLAHNAPVFGKAAAFSPAIFPTTISKFTDELESFSHQPDEVFISNSVYDFIWSPDAVALQKYFTGKDIETHYAEISAGHNVAAWRTFLDDVLVAFFGL